MKRKVLPAVHWSGTRHQSQSTEVCRWWNKSQSCSGKTSLWPTISIEYPLVTRINEKLSFFTMTCIITWQGGLACLWSGKKQNCKSYAVQWPTISIKYPCDHLWLSIVIIWNVEKNQDLGRILVLGLLVIEPSSKMQIMWSDHQP